MKETGASKETTADSEVVFDSGNEQGIVKIHENVIVSVVREATISVDGVIRLSGNSLVDNIAEIVGSRKIQDRSIKVNLDGPQAEIEVEVTIAYGSHIPTVAAGIQAKVKEDIEAITGMSVGKVDVVIQGLDHYPKTIEKESKEG